MKIAVGIDTRISNFDRVLWKTSLDDDDDDDDGRSGIFYLFLFFSSRWMCVCLFS